MTCISRGLILKKRWFFGGTPQENFSLAEGSLDMKNWLSWLACLSLVFSLLACAKPPVMIDRVLVKNATGSKITDVKVRHEPTNKFGAVNAILPERSLDIGFPRQPMLAQKALVRWRDYNGTEWSADVNLPYDRTATEEVRTMNLIYIIYPSGRVAAHLKESQINQ